MQQLIKAVLERQPDTVRKLIIEQKLDVNAPYVTAKGEIGSAIHFACMGEMDDNQITIVKLLLEHKADINTIFKDIFITRSDSELHIVSEHPVITCTFHKNTILLKLLLDYDKNIHMEQIKKAVRESIAGCDIESFMLLTRYTICDELTFCDKAYTLEEYYVNIYGDLYRGWCEGCMSLIDQNDAKYKMYIVLTITARVYEMLRFVQNKNPVEFVETINKVLQEFKYAPQELGNTLKYYGINTNFVIAEELIKKYASRTRVFNVLTPLLLTVYEQRYDAMEVLLCAGADCNYPDFHWEQPGNRVVFKDDAKAMALFVKYRCSLNPMRFTFDEKKKFPEKPLLFLACDDHHRCANVVREMLKHPDININENWTEQHPKCVGSALHHACFEVHGSKPINNEIVKMLLKAGVDMNRTYTGEIRGNPRGNWTMPSEHPVLTTTENNAYDTLEILCEHEKKLSDEVVNECLKTSLYRHFINCFRVLMKYHKRTHITHREYDRDNHTYGENETLTIMEFFKKYATESYYFDSVSEKEMVAEIENLTT